MRVEIESGGGRGGDGRGGEQNEAIPPGRGGNLRKRGF
jgi:hypothetical protein